MATFVGFHFDMFLRADIDTLLSLYAAASGFAMRVFIAAQRENIQMNISPRAR